MIIYARPVDTGSTHRSGPGVMRSSATRLVTRFRLWPARRGQLCSSSSCSCQQKCRSDSYDGTGSKDIRYVRFGMHRAADMAHSRSLAAARSNDLCAVRACMENWPMFLGSPSAKLAKARKSGDRPPCGGAARVAFSTPRRCLEVLLGSPRASVKVSGEFRSWGGWK